MSKLINITEALIENKIFILRGQKVMIDFDLAEMYGVETKALKQAVKRNMISFQKTSCLKCPISSFQIGGHIL